MTPVLLLLPGMLNDARVWDGVAAALGDAAEIRIPDLTTQDTLAEMARDAWALVADLPAGRPLVLAGFSMGGYVAMEMLAHPVRRLQGLALLDTNGRPESPEGAAQREKTIAAIERKFPAVVDGIVTFGTHADSQGNAHLLESLRQMMLDVGGPTAIRQNRAIAARADHRDVLRALRLPTRVVCGRADRVTPPDLAQELAATIPGAQLVWIEQAGHMAPMERPADVADALKPLLTPTEGDTP